MSSLRKIVYSILVLPGILIFLLLVTFVFSGNGQFSADYFLYIFPTDIGRNLSWTFPLSLVVGLIALIIIWSSGKGRGGGNGNRYDNQGKTTSVFSNTGYREYKNGNPYS